MKQASTSVPDYAYDVLTYLVEVTGKSQSAIIAPYVERGIFDELAKLEQHFESMEQSGLETPERLKDATDNRQNSKQNSKQK